MKKYKMLQTVPGSRDGLKVETFQKGRTYEFDATLAEQFYNLGAVEEAADDADTSENQESGDSSPNLREGVGKDGKIDPKTMRIEELVATARDVYGLDVNSKMPADDIMAAIEAAKSNGDSPDNKMKKAAPENKAKK